MTENGTLWIVATPIGTLADLSPRARETLEQVVVILAEDTRRTRGLLSHAGIGGHRRLMSLHEHNEEARVASVLHHLESGHDVALVSDAGTPVISDPGFLVVRAVRQKEFRVASVPGPSAFTTALAAAGQPPLPATLVGFLPSRPGARRRRISDLAVVPWSMVVFLSPHRLAAELKDLAEGLGRERPATLLAELSKINERAVASDLGALADDDEASNPRGEYALVIGPRPAVATVETPRDTDATRAAFDAAVKAGATRQEALKMVARKQGVRRRDVYAVMFGGTA